MSLPKVTICTPTFNRRPFIPMLIRCVNHQIYDKALIEWVIIDDGTDPIGDMVAHLPNVKYHYLTAKITLGKKRNMMHTKATGDIIIYMDDDDYYPPERVSHAVEMLMLNPSALCAGVSEMHVYFKHLKEMYKFGPYGQNHATAATFAFRREFLSFTEYDDTACVAEETNFLKNYTVPLVQLDSLKTILVFSHNHNSFDKRSMLANTSPYINKSAVLVEDVVKDKQTYAFFMDDIDNLLSAYVDGDISMKPDVLLNIELIKARRQHTIDMINEQSLRVANITREKLFAEQAVVLNDVMKENIKLKEKYDKMKSIMDSMVHAAKKN